jgi:hypothetical protein
MKSLIILLFIAFVSSDVIPNPKVIPKGLINRNVCLGGKIENGNCKCPNNTALIGYECKPCIGGTILLNRCKCPQGKLLIGNQCKLVPRSPKIPKRNISKIIRPIHRTYLPKKPVIYLYPKEIMDISVQLNIKKTKFTTIYPKFNEKNTWNVKAKPNGDILINDKTYPYLFWEAESYAPYETNEGFMVTEENAEKFLEEKLEILGLNEKEKTDFITFWLPVLLKNKISLCSFQSKQFFDSFELNITPKPDSLIRVFLTIKKLDRPINIKEQKLDSFERKGFTVIEWGGSKY